MYGIVQYGKLAFLGIRTSSISLFPAYCKAPATGVLFILKLSGKTGPASSQKSRIILAQCGASYSSVYATVRLAVGLPPLSLLVDWS